MRVSAIALVGLAVAITFLPVCGIDVDLEVARWFFDAETRSFPNPLESHFALLRDHSYISIITCVFLLLASSKVLPLGGINVPATAALLLLAPWSWVPGFW